MAEKQKGIVQKIKKLFVKKPQMGELSRSGTDIWGVTKGLPVYNPDDLVGKKGLEIYERMQKRDGQVKAVFMLKKFARLSTPWQILPEDQEDEEAVRQARFIEKCFGMMKGSVNSFLLKIWNAMRDGYAVEHGNLKPDGLIEGYDRRLPVEKFVIFSYNPQDDDSTSLYGESDFRAAYRYYFANDMIQRFWCIFLEKFGQPTVIGDYPHGTPKKKQEEYLDILKRIQSDTVIVKPEDLKAELLEASRRGNAGYKEAMEFNNNMIARSLLVGTLLMDTGDRGSWALSKTHFDIFIYVLNYLGEETEETLMKEQIIKRLIDLNFPNPKYPIFKFEPLIKEDQEAKAKICKMLVEAGLINPEEEWVRDFLDIPAKEKDIPLPPPKKAEMQVYQERRVLTKYERKVNFARIEKNLNEFEKRAIEELSAIMERQKEALKKQILKRQILERKSAAEIERLQLSYVGELRDKMKELLQEVWKYGREEVKSELAKKKYIDVIAGLPPEKALQYLNNKAFWIAGVIRDDVLKEAKAILYNGLKSGATNQEIMFQLDEFFKEYIGTDAIEIRTGKELTPWHLETVIRTNFTDAYNEGRWAMMNDPDVGDFVPAVMYSAILDDRTTEICRQLDGKVFLKNDPDVAKIKPPNHYNCRSMLVPVTKFEEFEPISRDAKMRILAIKPKNFTQTGEQDAL